MAYKQGSITLDHNDLVNDTQAIAGLGFRPTLVIFFGSPKTVMGGVVVHAKMIFGASDGVTQFCSWYGAEHGQGESQSASGTLEDACLVCQNPEIPIGRYSLDTLDADGFTIKVVDRVDQDYIVTYFAMDVPSVYVGLETLDPADAEGLTAVTGVGFLPELIIAASGDYNPVNGNGMFIGVSDGIVEMVSTVLSEHDRARSDDAHYIHNDSFISMFQAGNTSSIDVRGRIDSMDVDGFTIDWDEGPVRATVVGFIAFKDLDFKIGSFTMPAAGAKDVATAGFDPEQVLFVASVDTAFQAQDTKANHAHMSIGAADGIVQACGICWSQDDVGASDCVHTYFNHSVGGSFSTAETIARTLIFDSLGTEKFTVSDGAGNDQDIVWYVAFGPSSGPVGPSFMAGADVGVLF